MNPRALVATLFIGCGGTNAASTDAPLDAFQPIPPAGIVEWFSFDPGVYGSTRYQVAFGGPYATAFGPGYRGRGGYMDGVQQYALVDVKNGPLDFVGAFTDAAWVRPERVPADFEVIVSRSYGSADESSFVLSIDSGMHLRYGSQGNDSLVSSSAIAVGEWTHVAMSFDGTTKRIYINAVLEGSAPAPVAVTWDDHHLFIGADEGASVTMASHHLLGTVDEVMLFDRTLDAAELTGL